MNPVSMDRLRGDDWQTLRDLRLAALQESPHAFRAKLSDERRYRPVDFVADPLVAWSSRASPGRYGAGGVVPGGPVGDPVGGEPPGSGFRCW